MVTAKQETPPGPVSLFLTLSSTIQQNATQQRLRNCDRDRELKERRKRGCGGLWGLGVWVLIPFLYLEESLLSLSFNNRFLLLKWVLIDLHVTHTYPSSGEAETGGFQARGQPELFIQILSQNKQELGRWLSLRCALCTDSKHKDLCSAFNTRLKKPGMMVLTENPSTGLRGDRQIHGACWAASLSQ